MNPSTVRIEPNIIGEIGFPFLLIRVAINNAIIDITSRCPNNSHNTVVEGKLPAIKQIKDTTIIYAMINVSESLETLNFVLLTIVLINFIPIKFLW